MEEVVRALRIAGIPLYHFHAETPPQLEIALDALPPMEAIDCLMQTHETIKHLFINHGLKATMATRPLISNTFSANHTHISMLPSDCEEYFLAGLLGHIGVLCAFGMASHDSYIRVRGSSDTMGTWVSWGTENRDVPIRKIATGHWELRNADATANFYLFMSVTLSAGIQSVRENRKLSLKDCHYRPTSLSPRQHKKMGIDTRLPSSFVEAMEMLKRSDDMRKLLGDKIVALYVNVKERDEAVIGRMPDESRRPLFLKYF